MLVVLANGVAGGAEVLAGIGELDILQSEGGHSRMAAHHDVLIEALRQRRESDYSHVPKSSQRFHQFCVYKSVGLSSD